MKLTNKCITIIHEIRLYRTLRISIMYCIHIIRVSLGASRNIMYTYINTIALVSPLFPIIAEKILVI